MENPVSKEEYIVPLPESSQSKKEQVADMFDRISGKYDFLNHFLSAGIDRSWRNKAISSIKAIKPKIILDIATGTGDMAIASLKLNPEKVIGVDISEGMLAVGKKKIQEKGLSNQVRLDYGDSEQLSFADNTFDAITCAYGVRNFEHLENGLKEMFRVLKSGGKVAILEFSKPQKFPVKQFYAFYFRYVLPSLGRVVSKDARAYTYLPESVAVFPEGKIFCEILKNCGFSKVVARPLTFGITTLYTAFKQDQEKAN